MKNKFIIILVIFILVISGIIAYSRYLGTRGLKVKEYKVVSENISEAYNGLKVVHFSDIHYGMTIKYAELEKIVNQINFINPDLVVFTGDLFEKVVDDNMVKELTELFSKIKDSPAKLRFLLTFPEMVVKVASTLTLPSICPLTWMFCDALIKSPVIWPLIWMFGETPITSPNTSPSMVMLLDPK